MEGLEYKTKSELYNIRFEHEDMMTQSVLGRVSVMWEREGSMEARGTAVSLLV